MEMVIVAVNAPLHTTVMGGVVLVAGTQDTLKSHYNKVIVSTWTGHLKKMKLRDTADNNNFEMNMMTVTYVYQARIITK